MKIQRYYTEHYKDHLFWRILAFIGLMLLQLGFHSLFCCRSILHIPPEAEVLSHENPKMGNTNFSVQVLLIIA